jgi:signal transduction histidine kinase
VADEGQGFPPGFDQRAFERFSRAEAGRSMPGTGLGLAIVKAIAEAHGGAAVAANAEPRGAVVTLRLPSGADASAAVPDRSSGSADRV